MQVVFAGQGLCHCHHGGEADGEQFLRVVAAEIVSHQLEAYLARGGHGREGGQVLGDDVDARERQAAGNLPDVAKGAPLELGRLGRACVHTRIMAFLAGDFRVAFGEVVL